MIIYNVTIKVDWSIHEEWLQWMKEKQVPDMLATGFFLESQLVRLLNIDDSDGPTYAVQYTAYSMDNYNLFMHTVAAAQAQKEFVRWGDKIVAFSTLMEVVHNCG